MCVLLEDPRRQAPAIEVNTENCQVLLDEVGYELQAGGGSGIKRQRYKAPLEPFGETGDRTYFTPSKGGFVNKVRKATGKKAGAPAFTTRKVQIKKRGRPGHEDEEPDTENTPAI